MKNFNTLQELWDYCLYCPVCQRNCRQIHISVGPDHIFILVDFDKVNSILHLQCTSKTNYSYLVRYKIDCQNNTFNSEITNSVFLSSAHIKPEHFFFFLEGICNECNCSSVHSFDLDLDIDSKKFNDIGLEMENFCLLKAPDKFRINIIYDLLQDEMLVSKIITTENDPQAEMEWIEGHNSIELPVIKLDFSDQVKLSNKIKTLILFS